MQMDLRYCCVGWIPEFLFYCRGMATQLFIKRIVQNGVGKGHFIFIYRSYRIVVSRSYRW